MGYNYPYNLHRAKIDAKTIDYIKGRPFAPVDADWDKAVGYWKSLPSDCNARFDQALRAENPAYGIRDFEAIGELADAAGFASVDELQPTG